jgi:hypothetical protein
LFPKINNGFIVWNTSDNEIINVNQIEIEEKPKTGPFNKYIYL